MPTSGEMAGEQHTRKGSVHLALYDFSRNEEVEDLFRPLSRH
jgi:hypothetical protein